MMQKLLREIKQAFRSLCGAISPEELTSNSQLIQSITQVEKVLVALTR